MTICRQWSLVKSTPDIRKLRPLKCRSWGCEFCRPDRRSQLFALAASGDANRFLTLTINPRVGTDPADRLRLLSHAWRTFVKRVRREHGAKALEYLAVVEETKNGEPHLHILLRSVYLAQRDISAAMLGLIDSPIVDIRKIRGAKSVINYVAKYITKAPKQFNGSKRYWHSKDWSLVAEPKEVSQTLQEARYTVFRNEVTQIVAAWLREGWETTEEARDAFIAVRARWKP